MWKVVELWLFPYFKLKVYHFSSLPFNISVRTFLFSLKPIFMFYMCLFFLLSKFILGTKLTPTNYSDIKATVSA